MINREYFNTIIISVILIILIKIIVTKREDKVFIIKMYYA